MRQTSIIQPSVSENAHPGLSASSEERMIFIDFRCSFLGELRRRDLMDRFGIGSAAATRDIAFYRKNLGGKIALNSRSKTYQLENDFEPLFPHDVERAFSGLSRGFGEGQTTRARELIPCETPPVPCNPTVETLAPISRAVNLRYPLRIRYNSFSSGASDREIVPFALANNGHRWHARAFDRKRSRFIDIVLTRIEKVEELKDSAIEDHESQENDLEWGRILELELVPHPKEKFPDIVEMDYDMKGSMITVRVRAALASYLLRQWIVDCSEDHSLTGTEYRLWLRNSPILYGVENARLAPGYHN